MSARDWLAVCTAEEYHQNPSTAPGGGIENNQSLLLSITKYAINAGTAVDGSKPKKSDSKLQGYSRVAYGFNKLKFTPNQEI